MEKTIYARVVAKAINFPDDIEVSYITLNEAGAPTGGVYGGAHYNWEDVKQRFFVDQESAQTYEGYFRDGQSAFLGNKRVTIQLDDPVH